MIRRVLDESIYVHGSYTFESRAQMYRAITNAKRLLVDDGVRRPFEISAHVVDECTLHVIVKVPMFEQHEYTASLFGMLREAARAADIEARVDVM